MLGTEFCCTMNSERGNRKYANTSVREEVRGNRNSRRERESGCTYVCGMSRVRNTRRRTGKRRLLYIGSVFGRCCTNPRHPGDLVAGTWVRAAKGETEKIRAGRPGDFRTRGKRGVSVGVRCVSAGRGPDGRFSLHQYETELHSFPIK